MANKKISQLNTILNTSLANNDSIPIVDQSASETKRILVEELDLRWASKTHSHSMSDVTGLSSALAGKADTVHTHSMSDVTGLSSALAGKADTVHTHSMSDVTGLSSALAGKADTVHTHLASQITNFKTSVQQIEHSDILLSEVDDFTSSVVAGRLNFTVSATGTGAGVTANNAIGDLTVLGNRTLTTGTTATGRVSYYLSLDSTYFNGIQHTIEWKIRLDALSTPAVEQYVVYVGWGDNTGTGDMVDGAYFRYDSTVSGNWLAVTSSNSVREITDTGVAVTVFSYVKLKIEAESNGSAVRFYINNNLVATNTLNIPTTQARASGPFVKIEKQVGVTARVLHIDRVQIDARR